MSGVGRVIARVLERFPAPDRYRFVLYSHRPPHPDHAATAALPNVRWVEGRGPFARKGGAWFNFALPRILRKDRLNLFWGSQQVLPPFLPRGLPAVLTYYDLVLYFFPEAMRWPARLQQRLVQAYSVHRAGRILSISRQTQDDLLAKFAYPPGRAAVALLGYDPPAAPRKAPAKLPHGLKTNGFILAASTLEPRKNFGTLLEAYASYHLADPRGAYPLVIAGRRGWESPAFFARLEELTLQTKKIFWINGPNDDLLRELYRACAFFCLPSLYEGFGLTLLEALAWGAPALAADIGPFREIGGDRIEYLPPRDPAAWAAALARATARHRKGRLKRVRFPIREWSWERTARMHRAAFDELLEVSQDYA